MFLEVLVVSADTGRPYRWRWLILAVMLAAEVMDLLDATIVNVTGPSLQRSLHSSPVQLQWVIGGYALTLGAGLILGGRLGDRFGRRRLFLTGLAVFTVTSLLCAAAPTIGILIAVRLVQGAAAALLLPQGLGLLRENFPTAELGTVFGVFGPVLGIAGIAGPVLGGAVIAGDVFGLGWRAVFMVNVPVGVAAFVVAWAVVPRRSGDRSVVVDAVGAAVVAVSAALLVLPLSQGPAVGWSVWTWVSIAASVAGFALFTGQQRRSVRRGRTPLVTPALFRRAAYTVGLGGIALFFAGLVGTQLVLTLFLQLGHGFTAGHAGLENLPLALGTAVGGGLSGAVLAARLGRVVLQVGAVVQLGGAGLLWAELGHGGSFSIWQIVPGIAAAGVGSGLVIAALFSIILAAVPDAEIGSASGVLSAVQSIAGSVGVAVFGSVFFTAVRAGSATTGFRHAVVVQAVFLLAFLAVTVLFPARARPNENTTTVGVGKLPQPAPV